MLSRISLSPFITTLILLLLVTVARAEETDLVVLLDNASSMKQHDPGFLLRQVVSSFAGQLTPNTRISLFAFDEDSTRLMPFRAVGSSEQTIRKSLQQISYRATGSDRASAIEKAMHLLEHSAKTQSAKAIVLLTSGAAEDNAKAKKQRNTSGLLHELAKECTEEEIRLFAITFAKGANDQSLLSFAHQTHGRFFHVSTPDGMADAFHKLALVIAPSVATRAGNDAAPATKPLGVTPLAIPPAAPYTPAILATPPAVRVPAHPPVVRATQPSTRVPAAAPPPPIATIETTPRGAVAPEPQKEAAVPASPAAPTQAGRSVWLVWLLCFGGIAVLLWKLREKVAAIHVGSYFQKVRCALCSGPQQVGGSELLWSWVGGFFGIATVVLVAKWLFHSGDDQLLVIGSLGSSAVLVYGAPRSPLAQPRNLVGGHIVSAIVGVACYKLFPDIPAFAGALAVASAIAMMQVTCTLHPPGGATALVAVIGSANVHQLGWLFVLLPATLGPLVLLVVAVLVNAIPETRRHLVKAYWSST